MHRGHLGCCGDCEREHGGGAANLQEMATQIFVRATQQRIGGSGSAIGFAVRGRSRPAGRRARDKLQRGRAFAQPRPTGPGWPWSKGDPR